MALGINTNLASLSAQRALNNTQADTNTAMQRLSTGLRINSAKDDAAGMAVASRFTSQISGMQQASRNASDAVSMLQTAEGGLQSMTDNLQRIRELAVQAASDTITDTDRAYLNTEASQLVTEIERVANTTKYNGTALLDGSYKTSGLNIQVGADNTTNDRMEVKIADFNTSEIGHADSVKFTTAAYTHFVDQTSATSAGTAGKLTLEASIGGSQVFTFDVSANKTSAEIAALIKTQADSTANVTAVVSGTNSDIVTLTADDGSAITVESTLSAGTLGTGGTANTGNLSSGGAITVTLSDGSTSALASGTASTNSNKISTLTVDTQANARNAIDAVDSALKQINEGRAKMGAFQSRFESVVSNLNQGAENAQSGRSRVQDADFAVESANLAKNQVLQQAGMSVLAQANALPQQVLALLQ